MSRVLTLPAMSCLVLAAAYMPLAQATSLTAGQLGAGPTYHYILKEDQNPSVCEHMLQVFNNKFTRPWLAPPLSFAAQQGGADPIYSPHSKYAFPLLPGVKFSAKTAFNWRYFSQPSSPEFAAIHWQEGMAFPGGCPAGVTCSGEQPFPILIAHYDFDNDGETDTVIVEGSFPGYMDARDPSDPTLLVWRDHVFTLSGIASLWKLMYPQNHAHPAIQVRGRYLRPFLYENRAYVVRYIPHYAQLDADPQALPEWWWTPSRENMLVQQYSFTGKRDKIMKTPEWTVDTVCNFEMKATW